MPQAFGKLELVLNVHALSRYIAADRCSGAGGECRRNTMLVDEEASLLGKNKRLI
jgi:hypothetical protein